ncbi:endonuclease domain-containing protein [Frankia sp. AgKG'84/4]
MVGGTICGLTAARLHRMPGLLAHEAQESVDVADNNEGHHRRRNGYVRRCLALHPSDIVDLGGIPTTSVPRTLEDMALLSDRESFVCVVDGMLHQLRLSKGGLAGLRARVEARRNGHRARSWWPLIDGRSESPLETRLRLLLGDGGLPPEEIQWPVFDPVTGRPIARVDFAWPASRLAVEADGVGVHSEPAALYRDRVRQNSLVRLGWHVLRFTWRDVVADGPRIMALVGSALRDLGRARAGERRAAASGGERRGGRGGGRR